MSDNIHVKCLGCGVAPGHRCIPEESAGEEHAARGLLAKLIDVAKDRDNAVDRLRVALSKARINDPSSAYGKGFANGLQLAVEIINLQ